MTMHFPTFHDAAAAWAIDRTEFEKRGIHIGNAVVGYMTPEMKANPVAFDQALLGIGRGFAMDAQTQLVTLPNSAVPAMFTTIVDPDIYQVLWAKNQAAEILGEVRKGTWIDQTAMFPVVEQTGEVSSYGDFNTNGRAGANMNWPQRQSYLYQTVCEYGELEIERAGLGRINWVSSVDGAAITVLDKFMNDTYFKGVFGLQNYGLLNDPNLSAALTPAPKAYGGTAWVVNGQVKATANEIFADIQSLFLQMVTQTAGLVDQNTVMTLPMSPESQLAMTATNSFNVNVSDLLKKNFPNLRIVNAVQYGALNATNPAGNAAGNLVQLIAGAVEGQETGYCAYNEKLRAHPIIRDMSSWKKKMTAGSWGAIIRFPAGIAQMLGV